MFKLLSRLQDYNKAINTAADHSVWNVPGGTYSVLKARLRYDIGPKFHSLYDLIRLPEEEWPEFIIDESLKKILRKINKPEARALVNDKIAFMRHCREHAVPTINVLASVDSFNKTDSLNGVCVTSWETLLQDAPPELFIKLIDGSWGTDAFVAERKGPGEWVFCGQQGDLRGLHEFCIARLEGRRGWIVQPVLKNHPEMSRIMSSKALGTVRAVTFRRESQVELLFSALRIPVGENCADNFAHGSSGNLIAPIDLQTGRVGRARASRDKGWPDMLYVDRHPDTGQTIPGFVLPYWPDLVDLVCRAQKTFEALPTLGWDVAITETGPVVVEANATYDVDLLQVAYRRGLKTELLASRLAHYIR